MDREKLEQGIIGWLFHKDVAGWGFEHISDFGGKALFDSEKNRKIIDEIDKVVSDVGVFDLNIIDSIYKRDVNYIDDVCLQQAPSTPEGFMHLLEQLQKYYNADRLEVLMKTAAVNLTRSGDPYKTIAELKEGFGNILSHTSGVQKIGDVVNYIAKNIKEGKDVTRGLFIGLGALEHCINGWAKQKLYMLGALRKSGKTKFLLYLLYNFAEQNKPVLFHSLEMSKEEIAQWLLCLVLRKEWPEITNGSVSGKELDNAASYINNLPFYIDDRAGISMDDVIRSILYHKEKYGVEYVGVDYLQIIDYGSNLDNRISSEQKEISKLADVAKMEDVGIVVLSQVGKTAEGRFLKVRDLRGSSGIADSADVILLFNNECRIAERKSDFIAESYENKVSIEIEVVQRSGQSNVSFQLSGFLGYNWFEENSYG